jgi:hypothetical protein
LSQVYIVYIVFLTWFPVPRSFACFLKGKERDLCV